MSLATQQAAGGRALGHGVWNSQMIFYELNRGKGKHQWLQTYPQT